MTLDDALRGIENGQIVDGKPSCCSITGPQRHFIISPLARYLPRRRYLPVLFLLNTSTWRCENGRLGSSLYLQYSAERTRPAAELLARVPLADITSGVDLGCGPGNSTALLKQRWPSAQIAGVDNSPAMLEEARQALPDCHFVEADIRHYKPDQPLSLIYANASLQWIPDHYHLLPHRFHCSS